MKLKYTIVGDLGQWLSVLIMIVGIAYLFKCDIDIGTILFSSGCVVNTLATKYKYYGDEYIKRNRKLLIIAKYKKKKAHITQSSTVVDGCN
jgi:hypothetical protein